MKELGIIGHCGRDGGIVRMDLRRGYAGRYYNNHDPLSCTCCLDKIKHSLENNFDTTYSRGLLFEMEYRSQDVGRTANSLPGGTTQRESTSYHERLTWDQLRDRGLGIKEIIAGMRSDGVDPRQIKDVLLSIGMPEQYGRDVDGFNNY